MKLFLFFDDETLAQEIIKDIHHYNACYLLIFQYNIPF